MTAITGPVEALGTIPGFAPGTARVLQTLGGSDTNQSWLVQRDHAHYVLRVDTPVTARLGLDRQREKIIREHVARAGIAPPVLHCDPARGIFLSEYQPGRTWVRQDLHEPVNLQRLGACLKRLYSLPPVGAPLCLADAAMHYASQVGDGASLGLAREVAELLANVAQRTPVICHNDLIAANMVAGEQLWLIDWEYAAPGDPLFDLAVVIEHHALPGALWRSLVEHSLGTINHTMEQDLASYAAVYRRLVSLWTAVA